MKNLSRSFILFFILSSGLTMMPEGTKAQVSVSFQVFYDNLDPYGNWIDNSDYGYVWVPDVPVGFSPYSTNGYWVFTDDGWTWVSNYSWGWAPFHYGRWYDDPFYGWVWIPGDEWGPAWVSWRSSDDYYGWAPLGPGIDFDIDIVFGLGNAIPYPQWTFVKNTYLGRPDIYNYYVSPASNMTIINNTTVINNNRISNGRNTRYNAGPDRYEAEKRSGRTFKPVALKASNTPGHNFRNGELEIYKPRIEKNNGGRKPAPARIAKPDELKRNPGRNIKENYGQQQRQRDDRLQKQQQRDEQSQQQQQQKQRNGQQQQLEKQRNEQIKKQQQQQKQRDEQVQRQQQQQRQRNEQVQKEQQQQMQRQRNEQAQRQQQQQQQMQRQRNEQMQRQQQMQRQRNEQMQRQPQQQGPQQNQQQNQPPGKRGKG